MSANMNFTGRLVADPVVSTTSHGSQQCRLRVAVGTAAKDQEGKYKSMFIDVTAFGSQASVISSHFKKGSQIVVYGMVYDISANTGKDGKIYNNISINLNGFDFVGEKVTGNNNQGYQQNPQQAYTQPAASPISQPPAPSAPQNQAPNFGSNPMMMGTQPFAPIGGLGDNSSPAAFAAYF